MKIYVITPPTIPAATWLRRYATVLIATMLVVLATLGVGVAQALYPKAVSRMRALEPSVNVSTILDQHDRHAITR